MNLGQPTRKFASVNVDGWVNPTPGGGTEGVWHDNVAKGVIVVSLKTLSERPTTLVKRVLRLPEPLDMANTVIRLPDGSRYLVAYEIKDYRDDSVYSFAYQLQEVVEDIMVLSTSMVASASGMGSSSGVTTYSAPIPCYLERYSSLDSTEVASVTYNKTKILLPKGSEVSENHELAIGDRIFTIRESDLYLNLTRIYAVEK